MSPAQLFIAPCSLLRAFELVLPFLSPLELGEEPIPSGILVLARALPSPLSSRGRHIQRTRERGLHISTSYCVRCKYQMFSQRSLRSSNGERLGMCLVPKQVVVARISMTLDMLTLIRAYILRFDDRYSALRYISEDNPQPPLRRKKEKSCEHHKQERTKIMYDF